MAKPSSNRRLFLADGYTFLYWLDPAHVEEMLDDDAIEVCIDPRTEKEIGFKLKAPERVSSSPSLIPFGRVFDKLMQPPSINYPVPASVEPHIGNKLRIRVKHCRYLSKMYRLRGEEQLAAAVLHAEMSPDALSSFSPDSTQSIQA